MKTPKRKLTRRKILAGLGTIGVASAGAGLGTSAYFSDEESFEANTLTAGELDLKVDWEEHYNFPQLYGFENPIEGLNYTVHQTEPESTDQYVGLPDPESPMIWVHEDDLADYMSNTAIEAFPDTDNDGEQDVEGAGFENGLFYNPCMDGADLDEDLIPDGKEGIGRTRNEDTRDADDNERSLVYLDDVKPGDFGELTLSYHLCDNPGYVWLMGELVRDIDGANPEPEPNSNADLADEIQVVAWYDDGDNVFDRCEGQEEVHYLADYDYDSASRLYRVDLDGGNADAENLGEFADGDKEIEAVHIGTSPDGSKVYGIATSNQSGDRYLGIYDVADRDMSVVTVDTGDFSLGKISQAAVDTQGKLYAGSMDKEALFVIEDLDTVPKVEESIDVDVDISGSDNVFASNGQLYLHTNATNTIYTIDLLSGGANEVAQVDIDNDHITGLTIKDTGSGNFIASISDSNRIVEIDPSTGDIINEFDLIGDLQDHTWGDMATGKLCEREIISGTLRDVLTEMADGGVQLDDLGVNECFMPGYTRYIGMAWWLPTDVGNEVQGDSVEFNVGFYTEQCRHNDEPDGPSVAD